MLTPYVQDVNRWVSHYSGSVGSVKNNPVSDADTTGRPSAGSISELGSMSVVAVEPKGPLPPVPSAGPTASLNSVTPTETAVQQAKFDAMRNKIDNGSHANKRSTNSSARRGRGRGRGGKTSSASRSGNGGKQSGKNNGKSSQKGRKKKQLIGTPHDIFKSLTNKNGRSGTAKKGKKR